MTTPMAVARPASRLRSAAHGALEAALRESLEARQRQLADLQATAEELRDQSDGDSILARELVERAIAQAVDVIADTRRALEALVDGTYGTCERCHRAVAPARLKAIPHARYCVTCSAPALGLFA